MILGQQESKRERGEKSEWAEHRTGEGNSRASHP